MVCVAMCGVWCVVCGCVVSMYRMVENKSQADFGANMGSREPTLRNYSRTLCHTIEGVEWHKPI